MIIQRQWSIMDKINVDKRALHYFAEQLYVKAYSDGKEGVAIVNIEDVVKELAEQFTKDMDKSTLAIIRN